MIPAALGGGAPDVQAPPGRGDLDVGAGVELDELGGSLAGAARLIQAVVQVDAADAIAQDEADAFAALARGLQGAPRGRVTHRRESAGVRADGALGPVVAHPAGRARHRRGDPTLAGPVGRDPAAGRAEPGVTAPAGADGAVAPIPLARPHHLSVTDNPLGYQRITGRG